MEQQAQTRIQSVKMIRNFRLWIECRRRGTGKRAKKTPLVSQSSKKLNTAKIKASQRTLETAKGRKTRNRINVTEVSESTAEKTPSLKNSAAEPENKS